MLVLSRKKNQRFVIGDGPDAVTVTVIEVGSGRVRLGISAPKEVRVDRQEVREALDAEKAVTP